MTVQSYKEHSAPHCIPPSSPIIFPSQILRLVVWQKLEEMCFDNDSCVFFQKCTDNQIVRHGKIRAMGEKCPL